MPEDKEKKRLRQARYRDNHREELRAKSNAYHKANPEPQEKYRAGKRKEKNKNVVFAGIDGEAHREENGRSIYSFLRAGGLPPLICREGLSTKSVLEYLFKIPPGVVITGFVLNYDWENWLCDIPDEAYLYLTGDADIEPGDAATWERVIQETEEGEIYRNNTIVWEGYTISYFPRKIFSVSKEGFNGKTIARKVLDIWGYCQSAFLKACEDWDVATKEELKPIQEGKDRRDIFTWDELEYIAIYNEKELDLMARLSQKIFEGVKEACEIADLPIVPTPGDLYGPGAIARKLLKKIEWPNNLGRTTIPEYNKKIFLQTVEQAEEIQKEYLLTFPIIASYYGGRIEAAATGRFKKVYDYDLHSAYPSAIVRLPFIPNELKMRAYPNSFKGYAIDQAKKNRAIGMYYVLWKFPPGWQWYPFPTRQKKYQNVYYPANGQGWIASPELFAALDTIEDCEKYIRIYYTWTVPGSEGYGGGEKPVPDNLKSMVAIIIERMYTVRVEAKKAGLKGAQMALKLILNSMYGKLLQQIGVSLKKPGLFHDLVASWITSWTRAMIYRAIAIHRKTKTVVAIQTDGIVAKKKLNLVLTPALADWEVEELPDYRQLLPGLYDYQKPGEPRKVRRRGMPKTFVFEEAWNVMFKPGETCQVKFRTFLGRRLFLAQPYEYEGMLYQWPEMEKNFRPDLGAKRGNPLAVVSPGRKFGDCYLSKGKKENWLPPKINLMSGPGLPFVLKFEEAVFIPKEEWEIEQAKLEESEDEEAIRFFRE